MPAATARPPSHRIGAALVTVVLAAAGGCAQGADDDGIFAGGGGGGAADARDDADRDDRGGESATGDAPPVPDDVVDAFDEAIAATRSAESARLRLAIMIVSPVGDAGGAEVEADLSRDDVGTVTGTTGTAEQMSEISLRADGETVWITTDLPQVTETLPDGVSWAEGPVDELRDDGIWTGLDTTFDVLSVVRGVDEVHDGGVRRVGDDEVRLLEGEVDWEAALDACDGEERARLEDAISLTGDFVIEEFTATVGIDGAGRVRVLELDAVAGSERGFDSTILGIEMEITRLDHEVELPEPPPADETVPLDEVPVLATALADGL